MNESSIEVKSHWGVKIRNEYMERIAIISDIHGAHIDNFHGKTIFNVGSVGNPLEITQASYGIIEGKLNDKDKSSFTISLIRVPYDRDLAIQHVHLTDTRQKRIY